MLTVIASTKTQKTALLADVPATQPALLAQTATLVKHLQSLDQEELAHLLGISDRLAETTRQRYARFRLPHETDTAGSVLLSFTGDVFTAMQPQRFGADELRFANHHLRVLSGLYGILRPFDLMQPYRLEMGTTGSIGPETNLYRYWQDAITAQLNEALKDHPERMVVNCASLEYSRAIRRDHLAADLITMTFRQQVRGTVKTVPIHAKKARGLFVNWLITNRIDTKAQLHQFDRQGYHFVEQLSTDDEIVFLTESP
ncbi:YaaA family protein [Desulfofustis limnaeus]|jgi:cytoplasmic iron level regulating protein YaaA (DUF328/UPF0246 family)|uniref:UPF0246 protein DPPLL_00810 n=1 Tax=Desulfofustis limnaeus TaxID=2740163 RepID=A0ABM7W4F4_9BACT|nr:YaaA family protein [Desulfofustis limnaeus]MDX9895835.1 YaaA family protein [Desulfofustis sp.]BDD85716.1 UPF0246 protein YaaA [Desulfofustis limnaeus]